jgi:hypothetical protein
MTRRTIWTFALFAMLCGSALAARAQMVPAGDYTNQHFTAEHCVGYELQLWKLNGQLYGALSYCAGLTGDTPIGYIDHVVWNATTGKLTFDAKLSTGSHGDGKDGKPLWSKDFYQFDGTLTAKLLSGKITHTDMFYTPPQPEMVDVKLKLDKADTKVMTEYATLEAWKADNADIMAYRGPKW